MARRAKGERGRNQSENSCRARKFSPNKRASRIERGVSPHSLSRRVSASTSSGRFLTFGLPKISADYSGGTVADFHGLPLAFRIVQHRPSKSLFPEPAKLSSASLCAPPFTVNQLGKCGLAVLPLRGALLHRCA